MKKHGHYCKVCGEYKANEKFSGKGYAAHICKKCAALPPDVRSAQMIENKLLSLPWRLSKEQIKWLNNKTHDKRPEIRELAQEQLNMRFHPERLAPDDSDEFEDLLLNEDDDEDERSQNKSCVNFCSLPSSQICSTFRTQVFSLLLGSSGRMGFIRRTSRPIFRPSLVTHSILSSDASTAPEWIFAARLLSSCTISF